MSFSEFLESRRDSARALVTELKKVFPYASVLGVDVKSRSITVTKKASSIAPGMDTECGFVVKVSDGSIFFEYSLDDIGADACSLCQKITAAFRVNQALRDTAVGGITLADEPLEQSFARPSDFDRYSEEQLLAFCKEQNAALLAIQILAVTDADLAEKLAAARKKETDAVLAKDAELRAKYH